MLVCGCLMFSWPYGLLVCSGGLLILAPTLFILYRVDSLGLNPGSLIYGDGFLSEHFVVTKLIACTWWLHNNLTSYATYINTIICKIHNSPYMAAILKVAVTKQ